MLFARLRSGYREPILPPFPGTLEEFEHAVNLAAEAAIQAHAKEQGITLSTLTHGPESQQSQEQLEKKVENEGAPAGQAPTEKHRSLELKNIPLVQYGSLGSENIPSPQGNKHNSTFSKVEEIDKRGNILRQYKELICFYEDKVIEFQGCEQDKNDLIDKGLVIYEEYLKLELMPDPLMCRVRGNLLYHKGDYRSAIKNYRDALQLDRNAKNLYNIALTLENMFYFRKASVKYMEVVRLTPLDCDAMEGCVRTLEIIGDYEMAIRFSNEYNIASEILRNIKCSFVKLYKDYEAIIKFLCNKDLNVIDVPEVNLALVVQLFWTVTYLMEMSSIKSPSWLEKEFPLILKQLNEPELLSLIEKLSLKDEFIHVVTHANLAILSYKESENFSAKLMSTFSVDGGMIYKQKKIRSNLERFTKLHESYPKISQDNDEVLKYVRDSALCFAEFKKCKMENALIAEVASEIASRSRQVLLKNLDLQPDNTRFIVMKRHLMDQVSVSQKHKMDLKQRFGEDMYSRYLGKIESKFKAYQDASLQGNSTPRNLLILSTTKTSFPTKLIQLTKETIQIGNGNIQEKDKEKAEDSTTSPLLVKPIALIKYTSRSTL